jgi:chitodextrinase
MLKAGRTSRFAANAARGALVIAFVLGSSTAWAARDRTPPTTPTNLRVTGTTSYSASLAWNPSTDNSGQFSYVICCAYSNSATVGQQATSFTFTAGLEAGRTFSFRIYARDAAGNYSKGSNTVTARLPADTKPPTKPVVSATDVGPAHVSLAWSSMEDGPHVWYTVFKDGSPIITGSESTSAIIPLLQPETTYTFTVQARDFGMNSSPLSDPLTAATEASNPNDTTAPTTPANLYESNWGCETELTWDESTDDLDPQWVLEYQIYVNDVYDHSLSLRNTRTTVYGTVDGPNTFSVVAVDTAGNKAAPATITANLDCVP